MVIMVLGSTRFCDAVREVEKGKCVCVCCVCVGFDRTGVKREHIHNHKSCGVWAALVSVTAHNCPGIKWH